MTHLLPTGATKGLKETETAIFKTQIRRMRTRIQRMRRTWRTRWIWRIQRTRRIRQIPYEGFSVSFTLLLKVLYLLVSYPLSYTWLKRERQISIRKERFIRRDLEYGILGDCVF